MYPFNPYFLALTVVGIAALVIGQDLIEIPTDLSFSCDGRAYGYYADPATNCQVFHICLGERDIKWSFLCPNQTIFNQVKFMTFIITNEWSDIVSQGACNLFKKTKPRIHQVTKSPILKFKVLQNVFKIKNKA